MKSLGNVRRIDVCTVRAREMSLHEKGLWKDPQEGPAAREGQTVGFCTEVPSTPTHRWLKGWQRRLKLRLDELERFMFHVELFISPVLRQKSRNQDETLCEEHVTDHTVLFSIKSGASALLQKNTQCVLIWNAITLS